MQKLNKCINKDEKVKCIEYLFVLIVVYIIRIRWKAYSMCRCQEVYIKVLLTIAEDL